MKSKRKVESTYLDSSLHCTLNVDNFVNHVKSKSHIFCMQHQHELQILRYAYNIIVGTIGIIAAQTSTIYLGCMASSKPFLSLT